MCLLRKKRTSVRVHPKHRPDRIGSSRGYLATSPPRPLPGVRHACTRRAVSSPPMLRRVFTVLSALSLLLCALFTAAWIRSGLVEDRLEWRTRTPNMFSENRAFSGAGLVGVRRFSATREGPPAAVEEMTKEWLPAEPLVWTRRDKLGGLLPAAGPATAAERAGFFNQHQRSEFGTVVAGVRGTMESSFWTVPYWFAVMATAILPASRFLPPVLRWLRRRRGIRLGLCPRCGYDLRATPGRCPECGKVAGKEP
jgi:hypothetical protein